MKVNEIGEGGNVHLYNKIGETGRGWRRRGGSAGVLEGDAVPLCASWNMPGVQ